MRQPIWSFNIPPSPLSNPQGIWTFVDWFVQIPAPQCEIVFKYHTQVPDFIINIL